MFLIRQHCIFLSLVLCVSGSVLSQCPPVTQFSNRLYAIENSEASDANKLEDLKGLYTEYKQCKAARDSLYARIVHRLGNFYRLNGDVQKCIDYTKEAVSINRSPGKATDRSFLVNSYFNLGLCYWQENLYTQAQYYFDSSINLGLTYPAKYNVVFMAFEKMAFSFFQTGDYQKSSETAERGILLAIKEKDSLYEAILLSQKAQAQVELNDDNGAEKNIIRAIGILKKHEGGTYYLAAGYSIYASLLTKKRESAKAIRFYETAFQLNQKNNEWGQCTRDMINLGYLYDNMLHDYRKALSCYNKGIEIVKKTNETSELSGLYINIGVLYWRQKLYPQALSYYQKALNVLPINFADTATSSNPQPAMLKLVANEYYITTLLTNKADALLDQYKKEKKPELLSMALSTYSVADNAVDIMRWKQHGEQSKLFWRKKTKSMYEHAIEVCYLLKDFERALYFFEKSRAVMLNDKLSELGAKRFLTEADRVKEQRLAINVSSLKQQLSLLNETAANFNSTKQQLFSAQEESETFIKALELKYPFYYKYKYDNAIFPVKEVSKRLLNENQSLIEYFTGDSAVYVLSFSSAGNNFIRASVTDYSATCSEFMQLCSDRSLLNQQYPRYRFLAFKFYEQFFKPLKVPPGRVIISPDENFIPYDALLSDPNDPTSFLLKKYAFSYTYSMGLLMKNDVAKDQPGNSFLGIAPVHYQAYLNQQSLDGADLSLNNMRSFFSTAKFLTNEQANKKAFLENFHRFNIVQIYSHADADSSDIQPVLYLNDSSVSISDIQNLNNLQTRLIVLSACRTGVGRNARGEGIFSLARAFTAAGIPSTITTLWQIDNKATYQLTENFYKYLSMGITQDVALQKAKLDFLQRNDKTYELPYFWSANILLGKTDVLHKEETSHTLNKGLIVLAVLVIISFLYIVFKKVMLKK